MKRAFAVAGLMWGDEGKGATVDYLTRRYDARLIVRYNGGPQTAHNVVTPEGVHHTFSQFGSGTLAHPDVKTFLSRFMLVNPLTMAREEQVLGHAKRAYERTYVDSMALVVTPYHRAMNRIREYLRSQNRDQIHGSCGMGIGECRKYFMDYGLDAVFVGDLRDETVLYLKLKQMRIRLAALAQALLPLKDVPPDLGEIYDSLITTQLPTFLEAYLDWANCMDERIVGSSRLESLLHGTVNDTVIFEGAQGVLLDESHGTYPHNTWTDTTFNNANTLLREMRFDGEVTKIGCVRTYATRHGAGPFPTEQPYWGHSEQHNSNYGYAGRFRVGHFDAAAVLYALASCVDTPAVDYLAVSHFDALHSMEHGFKMCTTYDEQNNPVYAEFQRAGATKEAWWSTVREAIEKHTYTPVGLIAWGPTANDRMEIHGKCDGNRRRAIYPLPWIYCGAEGTAGIGESVYAGKA